jgi:hypothetical protein
MSSKLTEKILERIGRAPVTPDDLIKYADDKEHRNQIRALIMDEVQSKELTFHPQLNENSLRIQEKLAQKNGLIRDPVSKQTVYINRTKRAGQQDLTVPTYPEKSQTVRL